MWVVFQLRTSLELKTHPNPFGESTCFFMKYMNNKGERTGIQKCSFTGARHFCSRKMEVCSIYGFHICLLHFIPAFFQESHCGIYGSSFLHSLPQTTLRVACYHRIMFSPWSPIELHELEFELRSFQPKLNLLNTGTSFHDLLDSTIKWFYC